MKITFPSTINPEKYQFIYDTDSYARSGPFGYCFEYQERRNDGISFTYAMSLPTNLAGEYLISLSAILMGEENDELYRSLFYKLTNNIPNTDIIFASKVVYNAKKRKYYSTSLRKISSVSSKQYDKRFEQVHDELDGSVKSIFEILNGRNNEGFHQYDVAKTINKWRQSLKMREYRKLFMELPAKYLKWTDSYNEAAAIDYAYEAVMSALTIWKTKKEYKNHVDQYMQNAMVAKLES